MESSFEVQIAFDAKHHDFCFAVHCACRVHGFSKENVLQFQFYTMPNM